MAGNSGGARPGAGRKATGEVKKATIAFRTTGARKAQLQEQAKAQGVTVGQLVERILFREG